jgi:hypothetical protein
VTRLEFILVSIDVLLLVDLLLDIIESVSESSVDDNDFACRSGDSEGNLNLLDELDHDGEALIRDTLVSEGFLVL